MSTSEGTHRNADAVAGPCVSVIVPVYKAEEYVAEAMECMLNQTLREMEFIFVDDCGGDGSAEMIRRYAEKDPRIVLLCNDCNRGAGHSRNRGIEAARGKYIAFFDIDDSCDSNFYEILYNLAEKKDALIAKGDCADVYPNGRKEPSPLNADIRRGLAQGRKLYTCFCYGHFTAVYRREWVLETGARNGAFNQGEDTFFQLQVTQGADARFVLTDEVRYYYRHREISLSSVHGESFLLDQLASKQEKLDYLHAAGLGGRDYHKYCANLLDQLAHEFMPDVLACGEGEGFYNEYMDAVGRFLSGIKEPEGIKPHLHSAGGIAALRILADGNAERPWGKRFIAALLKNADPAVAAIRLPRTNGLADKLKRLFINALLAFLGMDRQTRGRFWARMGER